MKLLFFPLLAFISMNANAALLTIYADKASFQADAGMFTSFDFESVSTTNAFTDQDFGDFSVAAAGNAITLSVQDGANSSVFNSRHLDFFTNCCNVPDTMSINFDVGTTVFGFDFSNEDPSADFTILTADGSSFDVGSSYTSGFFGLISNVALTSFVFNDDPGNGGANTSTKFDNFMYKLDGNGNSGPSSVPEPTVIMLLGLGIVGLGISKQRGKSSTLSH